MKAGAGQGVDALSPTDFESMPDIALSELAQFYAVIEEELV